MLTTFHTLNDLFAQLGLPSDDVEIDNFLNTHNHLGTSLSLSEALLDAISSRVFA